MKLTIIAAIGKHRELGKDNQLIWHFPQDLQFFKNTTKGHTIVMGRKTFESLPGMLPHRHHIVISHSKKSFGPEVEVFDSPEAFYRAYQDSDEEIFVIGGSTIYTEMLPKADRLILTEIDQEYDADVFFPEFDSKAYQRIPLTDIVENGVHYQHVEYVKLAGL